MTQEEVNKIIEGQAKLNGKLDVMAATMDGIKERTRSEIATLFETKKEHSKAISDIERAYVPRNAFEYHERMQQKDFRTVHMQVGGIKTAVTRIVAVAGFALVASQLALRVFIG